MIKIFKLILKKERGFSLMEVMLGGSLLLGVGIAGSQLFKDQTVAQKRINNDHALEAFHNNLSKTMSLSENCNTNMKRLARLRVVAQTRTITSLGICYQFDVVGLPGQPGYRRSKCADDNTTLDGSFDAYTPEAYMQMPGIYIKNFDGYMDAWQIQKMELMDSLTHSGLVRLRVTYTTNPRVPYKKTIHKDIILNLRLSGGLFSECVDARENSMNNLQNDLCKSLGPLATWNDSKQICEIKNGSKDCLSTNQHVAGIGSDGTLTCATIPSGTTAASGLVEPTPSNCLSPKKVGISFDTTDRKMKLTCVD